MRDVSFSVSQGEAVGIIGPNGAGKTTLLKILAGITEPTAGDARTRGGVGALLDVGTGFHPELTGRENVFLIGSILGMRRREVRRRFDEIVSFAGVERFLDTPLKRYSTGMECGSPSPSPPTSSRRSLSSTRCSPSATPLSEKCLARCPRSAVADAPCSSSATTSGSWRGYCPRVLWIEDGTVRADGSPTEVISAYLGARAEHLLERRFEGEMLLPQS